MRKLKISLSILALFVGLASAYAFKPVEANNDDPKEYYIDPLTGLPGEEVIGSSDCDDVLPIACSAEYFVEGGEPTSQTGNEIHTGTRQ